jgi:hypothetical protein
LLPSSQAQGAIKTGTDERNVFDSSLDSNLHKQGFLSWTGLDFSGQSREKETALLD